MTHDKFKITKALKGALKISLLTGIFFGTSVCFTFNHLSCKSCKCLIYSKVTFFSSGLFRVLILWYAISGSVRKYTTKQMNKYYITLQTNINYLFILIRSDSISTFPMSHLYHASNTAYSGAAISLSLYKFSTNMFLKCK